MIDLSLLILETSYDAFKNNNVYTGTLTFSGTTSAGTNLKTFTVNLDESPDIVDIIFNGPAETGGLRPNDGWFSQGVIEVPSTGPSPALFQMYASVTGSTLTITGAYVQATVATYTLTSTNFSYRLVDYSIF